MKYYYNYLDHKQLSDLKANYLVPILSLKKLKLKSKEIKWLISYEVAVLGLKNKFIYKITRNTKIYKSWIPKLSILK